MGTWLYPQCFGIEGSLFALKQKNSSFQISSANHPILAIPFFDSIKNQESSFIVAFPGAVTGSITVDSKSRFWEWDINGLINIIHLVSGANRYNFQIVGLGGFHSLSLNESLTLSSNFMPGGNQVAVNDNFKTSNRFYGAQIGARGSLSYCRLTVDLTTKIALGKNFETQQINGQTNVVFAAGNQTSLTGGLFALQSNIGSFSNNQFAFVPEIQFKLEYKITPNIRPYVGYTFLYINHVIRPGNQINRNINPSYVPTFSITPSGSPSPLPVFHQSSYWVQGVNIGLEFSL